MIYNKKQFDCNTTFKGVLVKTIGNDESEKEESENDKTCSDEDVLRGSVGEMKLSIEDRNKAQLLGGMTKLCGELAYSAVGSCKIFKKIEVYGFLIDMTDLQSHVAKLTLDFVGQTSKIEWSTDTRNFNSCLLSLSCILQQCH